MIRTRRLKRRLTLLDLTEKLSLPPLCMDVIQRHNLLMTVIHPTNIWWPHRLMKMIKGILINLIIHILYTRTGQCDSIVFLSSFVYRFVAELVICELHISNYWKFIFISSDFDLYRDEEEIEKELQQKFQSKPGIAVGRNVFLEVLLKCFVFYIIVVLFSGVFCSIRACWWKPKQCVSSWGHSELQWERVERQHFQKSSHPKG